ncbi:MAG: hypothetical protein ACLFPI_07270, partial [Desulfobacterales bacterium]
FVRDPFTYCISDYKMKWVRHQGRISFKEYLYRMADPNREDPEKLVPVPRNNFGIYTIDREVVVDFLGKFENLSQDLKEVCEAIGLPFDEEQFPHTQKTQKDKDISEYYSDEENVKLVEDAFADEIKVHKSIDEIKKIDQKIT